MTTITGPRALRRSLVAAAGVLAVIGALVLASTVGAQAEDPPPPIGVETLSTPEQHNEFTDDVAVQVRDKPDGRSTEVVNLRDASNMAVFEFTIQPGAEFPWHTHPGPVLISIAEGDFVFVFAEDCAQREYGPGSALVDPGDTVHTAFNPSEDRETVVVATFLGVPGEGELTLPVTDDESAALDDECGIDREAIAAGH